MMLRTDAGGVGSRPENRVRRVEVLNNVSQQRVLRMDMGAPLDGCYDWHAYIGYVFQNLNAFIMDLAPHAGIGGVGERRPINTDHEVPSRPREDYYLIRSILGNPVEGIDNLRMCLCRESERPSIVMELHDQHAFGVPCQLQAAIGGEIVISKCLHDVLLYVPNL